MGSSVEEIVIEDLFPELKSPEIKDRNINIGSLAEEVVSKLKYAFRNYIVGTAINHAYDEGRDYAGVDDVKWAYRQLVPEKK